MSVGLNRSYQYAGINRVGKYRETAREKGPAQPGGAGQKAEGRNEVWRRVTGIFPHVSVSNEERRAGLKKLVEWIEKRVRESGDSRQPLRHEDAKTRSSSDSENSSCLGDLVVEVGDRGTVARAAKGEQRLPVAHGTGGQATSGTQMAHLSLAEEWDFAPKDWAGVQAEGRSFEAICFELGITRAGLTVLLKEHCGLSAGEFIDGLRFRSVKEALVCRLRDAAETLWGYPGNYVARKLEGPNERRTGGQASSGTWRRGVKNSAYFLSRPQDFFSESRFEERARRVAELCDMLSSRRGRTASQRQAGRGTLGTGGRATSGTFGGAVFDVESFAISAGFSSGARLKRACLNVLGKTLRQLEEILAAEVLQFYLCAEDRELREIASRENETALIFRARELYHRSEERPMEPFLDEWSKFEMLKPEWLSRMRFAFCESNF
jgi:hypothetical protein